MLAEWNSMLKNNASIERLSKGAYNATKIRNYHSIPQSNVVCDDA